MPQEPAPDDELITLRYPKSKSSAWVVWHGCVTCSNPFPAQPGFALSCSHALCSCIYWAFLNDKIKLIFRPMWILFKNWLLLSGSGLCCSVSHLDCLIGYLFSVNHINLKLNRKKSNQLKSNHSSFPVTVLGLLKIHLFLIKVTQTCFEGGFSVGYIFAGSEKVFSD